ncbi:MAG TPA: hypothetical protein VFF73_11235 [Planctomycetota bacterium]|nr:hypothetical protein [Planctomycetota bacterium]
MPFEPESVTAAEIRTFLEGPAQADVKAVQILHSALMMGIVVFTGLSLGLGLALHPPEQKDAEFLVRMLSLVNAAMTPTLVLVGLFISSQALRGPMHAITSDADSVATFVEHALGPLKGAWILRHALLEGAALFGATACFLASTMGVIQEHPVYFANLATPGLVIAWFVLGFPRTARLAEILRRQATGTAGAFWV